MTKFIPALAGAAATVAVAFAALQYHAARSATAKSIALQTHRTARLGEISEWQKKVRDAERRAVDAERDVAELLKAVHSVGARAELPPAGTVAPPNSQLSEEEKQRLAQERRYQQELAKKRAADAMENAQFYQEVIALDPEARFNKMIKRARELAANGEFQAAVRAYNQALSIKPEAMPLPEHARELQAMLHAQNSPIDVTLTSDGATFVSIMGTRQPDRFAHKTMNLMPGDYHVIGRRPGFRDIELLLKVRSDAPPPVVTVICTQPVAPPP